jgi:hypothetical protein
VLDTFLFYDKSRPSFFFINFSIIPLHASARILSCGKNFRSTPRSEDLQTEAMLSYLFCLSGKGCRGAFVRRSSTYGYENIAFQAKQ